MFKKGFISVLSSQPLLNVGSKFFANSVPVFMLHRFNVPGVGMKYTDSLHSIESLEFALSWLRKNKYSLVSVDDVANAIANGITLPKRSVAFTLDDGFWDQFEASAELFARYDCPATYYIATGFIEKNIWFWDSKAEYLFSKGSESRVATLDEHSTLFNKGDSPQLKLSKFIRWLKTLSYQDIERELKSLATFFNIELPTHAPSEYAPADWATIIAAQKNGLKIGAHTHAHPILSNESSSTATREMAMSRDIILKKVGACSDVFCYPVGRHQDFTLREERIAQQQGYIGAVSAIPGCSDLRKSDELFRIPRFGFPSNMEDFIQYASWIEPLKASLR